MREAESAGLAAGINGTRGLPSPPRSSTQPESKVPNQRQREVLLRMQNQIRNLLEVVESGA